MSSSGEPHNNNPFPGLRPFLEDEEYLFFGRESQVDAMVDKLAQTRFLSVVGTSGSGKSSLVNCGLQPALRSGLMASAGTNWRIARMRPGGDPLPALAEALSGQGVLFTDYPNEVMPLDEIIDITLRISKLGLVDIVNQAKLGDGVNLLLVVDQFEELFRYKHLGHEEKSNDSGNIEEATEFVNLLLAAVAQTDLPIYIVLTMRSDFLGDCAQFVGLAETMNNGQYLVPRLTREQRRFAISGPIGVGGASIEPVLLTRLVNDVGDNPDQLSILQHALNRTWAYWENEAGGQGPLSLQHYEAIGTMEGALDQHAEKAYAEVKKQNLQSACKKMFKALTDKATDARGIRRPTTLGNLRALTEANESELVKVIDVFRKPSRSFLMPPADVALESNTVVDISHESLMRVWKRLDKWASQEALSAQTYRRLAETAALYEKEDAGLLRDADLRVVQQWRDGSDPNETWGLSYNPDFSKAMTFLQKSEKADLKQRNIRRGIMGLVLCGLVAAAGSFAYIAEQATENAADAIVEKEEAEEAKEEAESKVVVEIRKSNQVIAEVTAEKAVVAAEKAVVAAEKAVVAAEKAEVVAEKSEVATQSNQVVEPIKNSAIETTKVAQANNAIAEAQSTQSMAKVESNKAMAEVKRAKAKAQAQLAKAKAEAQLANIMVESQPTETKRESDINRAAAERAMIVAATDKLQSKIENLLENVTKDDTANNFTDSDVSTSSSVNNTPSPTSSVVASNQNTTTLVDKGSVRNTETSRAPSVIVQTIPAPTTTVETEKSDAFVTCAAVEKLEPIGCKSNFDTGRVYFFARLVTALDEETLILKWLEDGGAEEPLHEKALTISRNPAGYRTYAWKTFKPGNYRACLYDQNGNEIRCTAFEVK